MNPIKACIILLLGVMGFDVRAESQQVVIEKEYLACSIKYSNTRNIDHFEKCSTKAIKDLLQITAINRRESGYVKKDMWQKTNKSLNSHLLKCENNARKSQKNSTIKSDLLSCQFYHARSLAYEATLLNQ